MSKPFYFAAAALAMISLAACSGNNNCQGNKCADREDQVFTGLLPAADGPGVRYTLKLDYDDDKNNMEGDYDLVETYVGADSLAQSGKNADVSFRSEGDFTVVDQNGKKYLKLVKDNRDSHARAVSNLYFQVDSDSTLTLVDNQLQPASNDSLNYTLKLVK